ncbi:MAG: peptidase and in kexin sedolisin [Actinomycetia bacterium]|nr:peptidase and in kexin sedolisin [Actinomycetes bacterium]
MAVLRRLTAAVLATGLVLMPATSASADQVRSDEQQFLDALNVQQAWNVTKGAGATVAVLDSGVDGSQQDLTGSVTTGPDFAAGANPAGIAPKRLHGTNMASIIAGHGHGSGSADGIVGVAPEARLLAARVILENDEPGFRIFNSNARFDDTIAKGIRWAVDHGADVINMSLGKSSPTKDDRQAVSYAISHGVVLVAAAGNDGTGKTYAPYSYPASFPGVISVAAVNSSHRHAGFSNRNSAVVVSAPGVQVVGAGPNDTYWVGDGTSPATAFVSGVAALVRSKYPKLAPPLVAQALVESTANRPSGGYDAGVGFGEVDAAGALRAAGRLAGTKLSGAGQSGDVRFTVGDVPPIQIVYRDRSLIAVYGGVGSATLLLFLGSIVFIIARRRRA